MSVSVVVAEDSLIKVVVVGDAVDRWHPFSWSNFPVSACSTVTHWFTFFLTRFQNIHFMCNLPKSTLIAAKSPNSPSVLVETMTKVDDGRDYDDAVRAKKECWPGWELLLSQIQWILQLGGFLGRALLLQFVSWGHTAPISVCILFDLFTSNIM